MRGGSEPGSYSRLIDFVYHSTLGLRISKKRKKDARRPGRKARNKKTGKQVLKLKTEN